MFKFMGSIFIIIACSFLACRKSFYDYNSYLLLKETKEIAEKLKLTGVFGEKYTDLFEKINLSECKFFKEFSFLERENFVLKLGENKFLYPQNVTNVGEFILTLGEKNKSAELEYITNNIHFFSQQAAELLERYKANQKLNLIFGISVGIIISLVIL
ncbi:MAG: hypothetical protein RR253_04650 [Oscillospiraceae bacterium]